MPAGRRLPTFSSRVRLTLPFSSRPCAGRRALDAGRVSFGPLCRSAAQRRGGALLPIRPAVFAARATVLARDFPGSNQTAGVASGGAGDAAHSCDASAVALANAPQGLSLVRAAARARPFDVSGNLGRRSAGAARNAARARIADCPRQDSTQLYG